jgi:NADPH-dependent 2,4-dienoyl-CoA reductase/sulfur reductase-like enzyme/nitrite reductase/ring-hydroxylating ferredoxin subunit
MSEAQSESNGPDLAQGVDLATLANGVPLLGHVGDEAVILVRRADEIFAIGATCTHYSGPLAEGLVVGDTVRCPWHHACFSLRTGQADRPPALDPVPCFKVERTGNRVRVGARQEPPAVQPAPAGAVQKIVIVGGGAAGNIAAETLRREGFAGSITILSADASPPCDRPNLSKDYLAGNADPGWIPLRSAQFYTDKKIDLRLDTRVAAIHPNAREVELADGKRLAYDALLLATGATPVSLGVPGADLPHVHYLRTLADCNAIIAAAEKAKTAVVIGASFIGLEVAASLRARKIEVTVVAPDAVPMERVMGKEVGRLVQTVHEEKGVSFKLGTKATVIDAKAVHLESGEALPADLVVVGIGVRPALELAEKAGLRTDKGVVVDEHLQTSIPGIFAAGDIARWPDPHTGERIRVEHWVLAERQGQTAARNMMGKTEKFDAVPFFWTAHYDFAIHYSGHAQSWDEIEVDGKIESRDCRVTYRKAGHILAVVTIDRDMESLKAEAKLEGVTAG